MEYGLYRLWLLICEEPDEREVVVYNEQAMGHRDVSLHVTFNCPRRFCELCRVERIIRYIDGAKVSIDIALLTFPHSWFYSAILAAKLRGIQIRLIADSQMICAQGSLVKQLLAAQIPVRCPPPNVMLHDKFCIIDGEQRVLELDTEQRRWHHRLWYRRGYLLTGPLNCTKVGTESNTEIVIVTSNRLINTPYEKLYNDMWKNFPVLDLEAFDSNTMPA